MRRHRRAAAKQVTAPLRESFLGLDISSTCVGWAYFEGGTPKVHGKFVPAGKEHGEKLQSFHGFLVNLLRQYRPGYVLIEKPFAGRNRHAFGVLMMYCGVALQAHFEVFGRELPAENRLMVAQVKKIVKARKGLTYEQRKKLMVLLMNRWYGLGLKFKTPDPSKKTSDDDIADAYAVVTAYLLQHFPALAAPAPTSRKKSS